MFSSTDVKVAVEKSVFANYNFNLKKGRYGFDVRRKSVTQLMVRHWNSLPGEAVCAPPLEHSRPGWIGALGSLSWWVEILPKAGKSWN